MRGDARDAGGVEGDRGGAVDGTDHSRGHHRRAGASRRRRRPGARRRRRDGPSMAVSSSSGIRRTVILTSPSAESRSKSSTRMTSRTWSGMDRCSIPLSTLSPFSRPTAGRWLRDLPGGSPYRAGVLMWTTPVGIPPGARLLRRVNPRFCDCDALDAAGNPRLIRQAVTLLVDDLIMRGGRLGRPLRRRRLRRRRGRGPVGGGVWARSGSCPRRVRSAEASRWGC